ncbi:MAG: histidinol-phosphate transaminase [Flammeovirgaceae bacterium]
MKQVDLKSLLRANIRELIPYSSARDEYKGSDAIFLDANENPFDTGYNRYPDPYQRALKAEISKIKHVPANQIFLGNGSDEAIDLLIRAFCEPHQDNIIALDPSYGMYRVCADTQGITTQKVRLNPDFSLNVENLLAAVNEHTKIIFLCSPNNPTGNLLDTQAVISVIEQFNGIVVVDEAYIDFCPEASQTKLLSRYNHLLVMQTFSKAWGLAGIRLGMAFASAEIIGIINKIKMPYNINALTQQYALEAVKKVSEKDQYVAGILKEKALLAEALSAMPLIQQVYPSDANFILIKLAQPNEVYTYLTQQKVIVRNRSNVTLCAGCLRITVGTAEENRLLLKELAKFESSFIAID